MKISKDFSHDSRSPSRDLNPELLAYGAGVLITRPRGSVAFLFNLHMYT
jgi:hypothetical protein